LQDIASEAGFGQKGTALAESKESNEFLHVRAKGLWRVVCIPMLSNADVYAIDVI
jgi:hypothetical protein